MRSWRPYKQKLQVLYEEDGSTRRAEIIRQHLQQLSLPRRKRDFFGGSSTWSAAIISWIVTLGTQCHSLRSDNELMDELEEILRRLGDAENVIETFIQYRLTDRSI